MLFLQRQVDEYLFKDLCSVYPDSLKMSATPLLVCPTAQTCCLGVVERQMHATPFSSICLVRPTTSSPVHQFDFLTLPGLAQSCPSATSLL